jgi:hypothetical protein
LWRFKNGHGVPDKTDLGRHPAIVLANPLQQKLASLKHPGGFGTLERATRSGGSMVNKS